MECCNPYPSQYCLIGPYANYSPIKIRSSSMMTSQGFTMLALNKMPDSCHYGRLNAKMSGVAYSAKG